MEFSAVVGLFYTASEATDVANRLKQEGVVADHIVVRRLRLSDPLPPTGAAQAHGYAGDPFWGSIILKKFGDRIGDGEAAVCVHADSQGEADIAVGTMKQYVPIAVELVPSKEVEAFLLLAQRTPAPTGEPK